MRFCALRSLLILFLNAAIGASSQSLVYKNITINHGLSSSEVYSSFQDSKGYMWFATENGISRFNGYSFQNFNVNDGLSDNIVLDIAENNGKIWIATLNGPPVYFKNDSIHKPKIAKSSCINSSISVKSNGGKLFASTISGLLYEKGDSLIKKTLWKNNYEEAFVGADKEGNLWYIGASGFGKLNRKLMHVADCAWEPDNIVFNRSFISKENFPFFLETYDIENEKILIKDKKMDEKFRQIFKYVNKDRILCFRKIENQYWVGTTNNGLYIFPQAFNARSTVRHLFEGKKISTIRPDKENNIWVTTIGAGVFFFPKTPFLNYTVKDGLSQDKINCVTKDINGNLWLGMDHGIVQKNIKNKLVFTLDKTQPRVTDIDCKLDKTWIGSDNGIYIIDDKVHSVALHYKNVIIHPGVKTLSKGTKGNVVVGTNGTFHTLSPEGKEISMAPASFLGNRVNRIVKDPDGTIWAATHQGLFHYIDTSLIYYNLPPLLNNNINDLQILNDSLFAICGKPFGLIIFNRKKGKVIYKSTDSPLFKGKIFKRIYKGQQQYNFWVITNNSINKIRFNASYTDLVGERIYDQSCGLISDEISSLCIDNDTVWIGTNEGLAQLIDRDIPLKTSLPLYLKQISVNEKAVPILKAYDLKHNQNNIQFIFEALCYIGNKGLEYHYKLFGLDSNWSITTNPQLKYNALPPGKYNLVVYVQNTEGFKSEPAYIPILISKPFWSRPFFLLNVFFLSILILWMIYFFQINRVKKREEKRRVAFVGRAKLELNALRAQMNPHFIFNSLNSVQRFIIQNNPEASYRFLSKFAKLIRYVLDNSKLTVISLEDEINAIKLYLDLERARLEDRFTYNIHVEKTADFSSIKIPSMIIQPYIENSIWHGFQNTGNDWKVQIKIEMKGANLQCIIEDNGVGRKLSEEKKQKNKYHHSVGTKVTSERLQLLNTFSDEKVSVKIVDLYDSEGKASGTRVELNIPVELNKSTYESNLN